MDKNIAALRRKGVTSFVVIEKLARNTEIIICNSMENLIENSDIVVLGVEDPDFDISVDSPVLIRKVEMYQYIAVGRDQYTRDFSERYERNLGAEKNDIYKNPQFPKGLESELFFGKVRIGDVLLGKEYLKNFSYSSYVNFSEQPEIYPVNVEEGGSKRFGLELLDRRQIGRASCRERV